MTERRSHQPHAGAGFWIAAVVGGGVIAFGIRSAVNDVSATGPAEFFAWVVAADVLHDILIAPLVCATGFMLTRVLSERWRTPVRSGLIISALVLLVSWPALRGYGRHHVRDNPTVQPLDYATALLTVLAVIWIGIALWTFIRLRSQRRARAETTTHSIRRC
jgi:hypothetical protein